MRQSGFTLIEVLMALAIIALSVGTAMRATSAAVSNNGDVRDRMMARWVGKNELARLQMAPALPALGTLSGEAMQGNVGFAWNASINSTPNPSFRKVEIIVRRQQETRSLVTIQGFVVGSR